MNNRVLVIKMSPYNGLNSSTLRTIAMVKGLHELDYNIDWLTIPSSSIHVENDLKQYEFLNDVNIITTHNNSGYDGIITAASKGNVKKKILDIIRKLYHRFAIFDYTEKIAKTIDLSVLPYKEYDFIITVSDPKTSHIAGKRLISQGLQYKRWIQYWGDPLVGDITRKKVYTKKHLKRIERELISDADKIVYTSPFTMIDEKTFHPDIADKMVVYPTAFINEKIFDKKTDNTFTVGYYGAYHSHVRNIKPLYDACALMSEIHLNLVGDTDLYLTEMENMTIKPRGDIREYEKNTDLYVCVLNSSGTQIPGKVYHYAATNRPILVVLDGENQERIAEYLKSFERYIVCDNTIESIQEAIDNIRKQNNMWGPCEQMRPKELAKKMLTF